MQEKVFQEARLERTIATRARGGFGEQAGEEDNVESFTFQLLCQKEKDKEVTDDEEEETKEGEDICYITGESKDIVSTSNSVKQLKKRGFEVTYMYEPMEEDGQDAESREDTRGLNSTLCWGGGVRHSLGFTAPQWQDTQEIVYLWIMI